MQALCSANSTVYCGDDVKFNKSCVQTLTNSAACGDCFTDCYTALRSTNYYSLKAYCDGGSCRLRCWQPDVETLCGDDCFRLDTDVNNCGDCGFACIGDSHGTSACVDGR